LTTAVDCATSGHTAIAWQRITATRDGKTLDEKEAIVFAVRDGRIAEVWHRPDQYAFDEFFS
jgi:ketosteroid isomerase-like protein